jgi:hypothetical protein
VLCDSVYWKDTKKELYASNEDRILCYTPAVVGYDGVRTFGAMMNRIYKICVFSAGFFAAAAMSGFEDGEDVQKFKLLGAPAIVELGNAELGELNRLCVGTFQTDSEPILFRHVFGPVGPSDSCPKEYNGYRNDDHQNGRFFIGVSTTTGDLGRTESLDGKHRKFLTNPSMIFVTLKDEVSGAETFYAYCLGTLRLHSKLHPGEREYRQIVYKRNPEPKTIENEESPVTCGDLSFAVKNQYPLSKPSFIGSPEEFEATKKHNPKVATKTSLPASPRENHSGKKK